MSFSLSNRNSECLHSQRSGRQLACLEPQGAKDGQKNISYWGLLNQGDYAPKQRDQWLIDLNALSYAESGNQKDAISSYTPSMHM